MIFMSEMVSIIFSLKNSLHLVPKKFLNENPLLEYLLKNTPKIINVTSQK